MKSTRIFLSVLAASLSTLLRADAPGPTDFGANIKVSLDQPQEMIHREPTLAVNPLQPANLVLGFMNRKSEISALGTCGVAFSPDAGGTWTLAGTTPLQAEGDRCGDPSVAGGPDGTFYYAYIDGSLGPGARDTDADLVVARSHDGGRTFPEFTVAVDGGSFLEAIVDKPYLAVDAGPRSRYAGNLYMSYTDGIDFGYEIKVVVSRDGGRTWSAPALLSRLASFDSPDIIEGSLPVVGPDGTVYIFWADGNAFTGPMSIDFVKSTDGGRRWTSPAHVAAGLPSPVGFFVKNADPNFGVIGNRGAVGNSFPAATVGSNGTIYVAWNDFPGGTCFDVGGFSLDCVNADVRMSVSTNGGRTWTAPARVSDKPGATDQLYPWIASSPGGPVHIIWIDRRLDPDNVNYDLFYTSTIDGSTFTPAIRVSTATSLLDSGQNFGDYNALAATSNRVVAAWGDMRDRTLEIDAASGVLAP